MGELLARQPCDILFNLCQYGRGDVWAWGAEVGGHTWRTTDDVGWAGRTNDLPGFYAVALSNTWLHEHAGPGRWNDPDYILIGWYGDARKERVARATDLTPAEQCSYMSLWALMAALLFFSGDMEKLDDLTLDVLCNGEILAIDQDALGRQARIVCRTPTELVLAKPLEDGSLAVGVFAFGPVPQTVRVEWAGLGLVGRYRVRDCWRQRDLGEHDTGWSADLPRHGSAVWRLSPVGG